MFSRFTWNFPYFFVRLFFSYPDLLSVSPHDSLFFILQCFPLISVKQDYMFPYSYRSDINFFIPLFAIFFFSTIPSLYPNILQPIIHFLKLFKFIFYADNLYLPSTHLWASFLCSITIGYFLPLFLLISQVFTYLRLPHLLNCSLISLSTWNGQTNYMPLCSLHLHVGISHQTLF